MKNLKRLFFPLVALASLVLAFFRSRHTDKGELEKVYSDGQGAKAEAIKVKSELDKEKINNDTGQKLDDAAAVSDADIIADAVNGYRSR